jgi:nicotinamidase-related amidase
MERMMHAWRIEEREYARQESRRGRRHAFTRLAPDRTALVVVDMVPFFARQNAYTRGIVPNIARLAGELRPAGGTVVWALPGAVEPSPVDEAFFGPEFATMFSRSGGEGPLRTRVWHEFEVDDADLLVEKKAMSAFFPGFSPLPDLLKARGIDTVLITGTVTNVCSESSAHRG